MRDFNVAVVGATGAVGREMVKILEERNFPINKLKLLATERSAGSKIEYKGEQITVEVIKPGVFKDINLALFSAGSGPSKSIAPQAVAEGAIVIDNSNAFRMDKKVPLVIPEINPLEIFKHQGIIANPNCSTIQMALALKPIYDHAGIKRVVVTTFQAVSGTGKKAIDELTQQVEQFVRGEELTSQVYPYQIAFNVLPQIDIFEDEGYTLEEMKMVRETRKILDDQNLQISATAVRVPVFFGHSEAVNIETEREISIPRLKELLDQTEGLKVIDQPAELKYPLAVMTEKDDSVLVGRLRRDFSIKNGINMWVVANNLRKGAALNAVQIAERLIAGGLK